MGGPEKLAKRKADGHLNARERTSTEDLRRIAARYFIPENRTVGIVRSPERAAATQEAAR